MLARDSIVYFIVIFGLCASIGGLLVLTLTLHYFVACLAMDILTSVDDNIPFGVTT
jgi:hypothetical protein